MSPDVKKEILARLRRQRALESVSVLFLVALTWLCATRPDLGLIVFACGISFHARTLDSRMPEIQVRDD